MPAERIKNLHLSGADNILTGANAKFTAGAGTVVDLAAATVLLPDGTGGPGTGTPGAGAGALKAADPDRPPAAPATENDEFDGADANPLWAWTNQGTAALDRANGLTFTRPGVGSFSLALYLQPLPTSGDWEFVTKCGPLGTVAASDSAGLVLYNSSTGAFRLFRSCCTGGAFAWYLDFWNSVSSFGSQTTASLLFGTVYLKFRNLSGTVSGYLSYDGIAWLPVGTTFSAAGFDRVGLNVDAFASHDARGRFWFFRRTL